MKRQQWLAGLTLAFSILAMVGFVGVRSHIARAEQAVTVYKTPH